MFSGVWLSIFPHPPRQSGILLNNLTLVGIYPKTRPKLRYLNVSGLIRGVFNYTIPEKETKRIYVYVL